ncbi:MAG: type II toxin-antitoxin system VapC family toxin [Rhizobiaceae bacterium]|nr:type II toxin-antitoxin system VapC family toxin [Rhizobiaceae bacterium]
MFVDAAAIVAILSGEAEEPRCSAALTAAPHPFTNPIAAWEAIVALARADKFDSYDLAEAAVRRLLNRREIEVRQMPPPDETLALSTEAARRYQRGTRRLNIADCFHYACARHFGVPILSTADEFRFTDLETVP